MADLYPPWHERAIRHSLANVRSGSGGNAGGDGRHHPIADPAVLPGPDGDGATDQDAGALLDCRPSDTDEDADILVQPERSDTPGGE